VWVLRNDKHELSSGHIEQIELNEIKSFQLLLMAWLIFLHEEVVFGDSLAARRLARD
jgi:hypothetical protein